MSLFVANTLVELNLSTLSIPVVVLQELRRLRPATALAAWVRLAGVTQGRIAKEIGRSPARLSEWLNGKSGFEDGDVLRVLEFLSVQPFEGATTPISSVDALELTKASGSTELDGRVWLQQRVRAVDEIETVGWVESGYLCRPNGNGAPIGVCPQTLRFLLSKMQYGRGLDALSWREYADVGALSRDLAQGAVQAVVPAIEVPHRLDGFYVPLPRLYLPVEGLLRADERFLVGLDRVSGTIQSILEWRMRLASRAHFIVASSDLADNFLDGFLSARAYAGRVHRVPELDSRALARAFSEFVGAKEEIPVVLLTDQQTMSECRSHLTRARVDLSQMIRLGPHGRVPGSRDTPIGLPSFQVSIGTHSRELRDALRLAVDSVVDAEPIGLVEQYLLGLRDCLGDVGSSDLFENLEDVFGSTDLQRLADPEELRRDSRRIESDE